MSVVARTDLGCRVPECGRAAVGYVQVTRLGRREVYVGWPAAADHFPVCAEHLDAASERPRRD